MSREGAEREMETQNPKQAPGSGLISTEPDVGLELMSCEIMTWAEVGCLTDWANQAPLLWYIILEQPIIFPTNLDISWAIDKLSSIFMMEHCVRTILNWIAFGFSPSSGYLSLPFKLIPLVISNNRTGKSIKSFRKHKRITYPGSEKGHSHFEMTQGQIFHSCKDVEITI